MKKLKLLIKIGLLSLTVLHSAILYSAELSIIIKEKGTGEPVEGATVVWVETDNYDTSTSEGIVKFDNIEISKKIKVVATGFITQIFSVPQNKTPLIFYIEPILIEGDGMEVTAQRLVEKTSKISLSSSELSKAAGGVADPLLTVTALPGTITTEEGTASVYMRGSNGNDNIIWINNTPVGYLYHFGGFQSTIHPSLIKDINVFLGGFPVQYGDALGGVLDVQLRPPANDRMRYRFDLSSITSSFLIEGPVGNASGDSFAIGGRRSYMDLIWSPEDINELLGDDDPDEFIVVPNFYDFEVLYHHPMSGGYLDSYYYSAGDEMELSLGSTTKTDPQLAGNFGEKIAYQSTGFTWQQRWNKKWNSITTLAYLNNKSEVSGGTDDSGGPIFANIEKKTLHFQPEFSWQSEADSLFSFGIVTSYTWTPIDLNAPRAYTIRDRDYGTTSQKILRLDKEVKTGEISPYVRYRQQWTNRLTTQTGLRYTNIGVTGGFRTHKISPRVSLEYKLSPSTLLLTSWGKYIQMPDSEQVVAQFGNPSLLMTEAEHRIIGVEHTINSLYSVKAEIYHKPMTNLVLALDGNNPPDNYKNLGSGEAYGFDLFVKRAASQGKTGWLSFSWANSNRTNEITGVTRKFSGDQPLTFTAVWGQPFPGSWKHWDFSIKTVLQSGKPYTKVVGRSQANSNDINSPWVAEYGEFNGARLPTYYRVDLRIGRNILLNKSKLKLYFDLYNVTLAKNVVAYQYGDDYENIDNPTEVSGYSFFPYMGVEMEF